MRWVTYADVLGDRVGVIHGDRVHGLARGVSLVELVAGGPEGLSEAGEQARREPDEVRPLDELQLRAPIPQPPSVRDCLCFLDHMRNCQAAIGSGSELDDVWYQIPAMYFACPSTIVGPYDDVAISPGSAAFDFELELGAVIGRGGRDLSPEQGLRAIVGYTIYCDWSARDLQMLEAGLRIGQAKGKDGATTLGPFLITADELAPYLADGRLNLSVAAYVNDRLIGSGSAAAMDWSFGEIVSYASRGVDLKPGDVLGSGTVPTCTLVEHMRAPDFPGWLHSGDVVRLHVDELGDTRQTVCTYPSQPVPLAPRPHPAAQKGVPT